MADSSISGYSALAALAAGDLLEIVDVSDTSLAATGTNKKVDITTLFGAIPVNIGASGTANRFGTATTNDANADTMFSASGTTKKALVVQAKATPTASPFVVQQSDGTPFFQIQSDGGIIMDQRTGATFSTIASFRYQGTEQCGVGFGGTVSARVGFNGAGGLFSADSAGKVVAAGDVSTRHYLGQGTSPTVADDGGNDSTIAGKDAFCKVTVGTGTTTTITITFGTAYATAPVVVCSGSVSSDIKVASTTTTATLTHAGFTDGEVLHVVCGGF